MKGTAAFAPAYALFLALSAFSHGAPAAAQPSDATAQIWPFGNVGDPVNYPRTVSSPQEGRKVFYNALLANKYPLVKKMTGGRVPLFLEADENQGDEAGTSIGYEHAETWVPGFSGLRNFEEAEIRPNAFQDWPVYQRAGDKQTGQFVLAAYPDNPPLTSKTIADHWGLLNPAPDFLSHPAQSLARFVWDTVRLKGEYDIGASLDKFRSGSPLGAYAIGAGLKLLPNVHFHVQGIFIPTGDSGVHFTSRLGVGISADITNIFTHSGDPNSDKSSSAKPSSTEPAPQAPGAGEAPRAGATSATTGRQIGSG